jgi:hypothetical protein
MNIYELQEKIEDLILSKREDDYWDFKEKHHSNTADLLHDIICMANNRADRDAYIIYGVVDKTGNVIGVESDPGRRNQQEIINQLKSKKFVSGIRPRIELRTLNIQAHEIDVLIVKNTSDTPYYLIEDYKGKDQRRIVRAYHIYTRVCDTNTDIDKSADIDHTEYLWKKRFGLTTVPLERFIKKLKNKEEWIEKENFYYSKYNPEYTIVYDEEEGEKREKPEFYAYAMCNSSVNYRYLNVKYFETRLYGACIVLLDSGRFTTTVPEWGFLKFDKYKMDITYSFKYYLKNDISYMLHKFLLREDSEEAKYACERFYEVVLIFADEMEKDDFISFIYCKKEEMIKRVEQISKEYSWIEAENKRSRDEIIKRLKAGIVLNEMLVEFRQ